MVILWPAFVAPARADTPADSSKARGPQPEQPCNTLWNVRGSADVVLDTNEFINRVAVVSASDVWAVGYYSYGYNFDHLRTLIKHWDGSAWTLVASPNPGSKSNFLRDVTSVASNDIWAVGSYGSVGGDSTLVINWNGSSWTQVASPNPGTASNLLTNVDALSSTDIWVVGSYESSSSGLDQTLAMRWNCSTWSVMYAPNPGQVRSESRVK